MRTKCAVLVVAIGLACGCSDSVADANKNLKPVTATKEGLDAAQASGKGAAAAPKASTPP